MSKSIRSKWKRKCRAVKRERYAVKELARLKKMLKIAEPEKKESEVMEAETVQPEEDQVIFLDAGEVKEKINKKKKKSKVLEEEEDVPMSSDEEENVEVAAEDGAKRIFSTKTLKDQNGAYPAWLHKRKIAKMNKGLVKKTKKRTKKRYNKRAIK